MSAGDTREKGGALTAWVPGSPGGGVELERDSSGLRGWRGSPGGGDWSTVTTLEAKNGPSADE